LQVLNQLEHQDDSPPAVAMREMRRALYGAGSIYARTPTAAGVASISREDMQRFVQAWERPDGAVLGISGDFEPEAMMQAGPGAAAAAGEGLVLCQSFDCRRSRL
jgi:zinc protease